MHLTMATMTSLRRGQTGAYLLEVLIGVLIFALGVLGIVGLQAASLRSTSDASLRAEAVLAANQLMAQMWTDDETKLAATYDSTLGGQGYLDFAAQLKAVQGGAWAQDPTVLVNAGCNMGVAPSQTSQIVTIQIYWQSPTGSVACGAGVVCHSYSTCGVIGQN
jgi:type IV pilus assembly protein PilV